MSGSGRQSPSPSQQTGKQLHDPPAGGQGVDDSSHKDQTNKDQLANLESNPKWPMDAEVEKKFAKNTKMGDEKQE
ncbi:hypothetical protein QBC35DRAFT_418656 [Podospora australis]|uniref:Uncharacterized protein n=1 Tax=Podospora australis TaxID=1536484 RepID=A0AAN7AF50_9PEZI|nr:hypothetical protein QBC35DRAFT_418656 [Podospora australis]